MERQEMILDANYFYKGSMNGRITIVFDDNNEYEYGDYYLINDYKETMYKTKSLGATCNFIIDLLIGKYA